MIVSDRARLMRFATNECQNAHVSVDWAALATGLSGEVLLPDSPAYEGLRRPAMARYHDVRPAAVVRCADPADVVEVLSFVRESRLPFAIRSGGHCFAGGSSSSGVVVDLTLLSGIALNGDRAHLGAGARLAAVYDGLAEHGRTIPAGCGPTVGIAGLTLGGGLGILGRAYGLTCDSLTAAEVVLADGRIVECDPDRHDDLFWGLRGGGAIGLGVVTALTFATVPAPAMTGFRLIWPYKWAPAVAAAWQDWAPDAPDGLAASLQLVAPADPGERPVAVVVGAMLGHDHRALDDLAGHVGADPESSTRVPASHRETKHLLAAVDSAEPPGLVSTKTGFFARPLPRSALDALAVHLVADRVAGQARTLAFTPLGGEYNRVPPDATAYVHRGERFLIEHVAVVAPESPAGARDAAAAWPAGSHGILDAWRSPGVYQNFPDPELPDPQRAYFGDNLPRLRAVKARYDPEERLPSLTCGSPRST
jgi:FAD/FMN-containing dehydrogenase